MEKFCAEEEGENDRKAAHQRGDGNRGFGGGDAVEVKPVRRREEDPDQRNRAAPFERRAREAERALGGEDERVKDDESELEDELDRLDRRGANLKNVFVPNGGERREKRARDRAPDRAVAEEVDALVAARPRKNEVARENRRHAEGLDGRRNLAVERGGEEEDERGGGGANRGCNRNREGAERAEGEYPRRRDDDAFCGAKQEDARRQVSARGEASAERHREDERAAPARCRKEERREDGVVAHARLFREVVEGEEDGA